MLIHAKPCSPTSSASCPSTARRNLHHMARSSSSSATARTQEARHLPRLRRQPYGCASGSRRASRTTISNLYGMFIDEYLSTWISLSGNAGGRKRLVAEIIKAASARCGHPRVGRSPPRGGQAAPPEHTRKERRTAQLRRLLPTFPTSSEGVTNPRC